MNTCTTLPEHYEELLSIDLQRDKKMALVVNGLSLVIMGVLAGVGAALVPLSTLFSVEMGLGAYLLRMAALLVGIPVYLVLHELVHGVFIRLFSGRKVSYGFTGLYAYAGSDAYFGKVHYIIIALAPIVVWGVVLALVNCLVAQDWWWVVYFIQIINLSGAAGDLYVTCRFIRLSPDILVRDSGTAMTVYAPR